MINSHHVTQVLGGRPTYRPNVHCICSMHECPACQRATGVSCVAYTELFRIDNEQHEVRYGFEVRGSIFGHTIVSAPNCGPYGLEDQKNNTDLPWRMDRTTS